MRHILLAGLLLLAGTFAGCETLHLGGGRIVEGLPKHTEKFPKDVAFFVPRTEKRVQKAFEDALRARGFEVVKTVEEGDVVVHAKVEAWEFNDAGFSGFGPRDDMELSVRLVDRRRKRVLARARISIRSDFKIIDEYVRGL